MSARARHSTLSDVDGRSHTDAGLRDQRGFTLIEILVVIIILGILIALPFSFLQVESPAMVAKTLDALANCATASAKPSAWSSLR